MASAYCPGLLFPLCLWDFLESLSMLLKGLNYFNHFKTFSIEIILSVTLLDLFLSSFFNGYRVFR